jgi:hypothetical protein
MRRLRAIGLRLAATLFPWRREQEMADELESHLQMHVADYVRAGIPPDEARRRALIALGGLEAMKERCRDRRRIPFFDALRQDAVYALRTLRRTPASPPSRSRRSRSASGPTPPCSASSTPCCSGRCRLPIRRAW